MQLKFNKPYKSGALRRIGMTHLVNQFDNNQLKNVSKRVDLFDAAAQIVEGPLLVGMYEHHERVPLARHVLLSLEKVGDEFGRIRHQKVKILVDGEYGHDGVAAHVAVLVLEAGAYRGHERLDELRLLELAQEAERGAAYKLVGMLQITSVRIAHQYHLLHELAVGCVLGHNLPEDEQQLLERVVRHRHHEPDDGHQQGGKLFAVQHQLNHIFERLRFDL